MLDRIHVVYVHKEIVEILCAESPHKKHGVIKKIEVNFLLSNFLHIKYVDFLLSHRIIIVRQ